MKATCPYIDPTIAEALTRDASNLAVDGVLLIAEHAEHGKYPVNAISQDTLVALAVRDPRSAAHVLLSLPSLDRQVGWIDNLVVRWAISDLPGAVEFARELPEGTVKDKALKTVASWWSRSDPKAALEFSVSLPDSEARREILNDAVRGAAHEDLQTAARWVQELPPGDGKDQALKSVAQQWSQQDPEAAAAWLLRLPADSARFQSLKRPASAPIQALPKFFLSTSAL